MFHQVDKTTFAQALSELGHNPNEYEGKRLSLASMVELYELWEIRFSMQSMIRRLQHTMTSKKIQSGLMLLMLHITITAD